MRALLLAIALLGARPAAADVVERPRLVPPVCRVARLPDEPRPAWPWLGGGALAVAAGLAAAGEDRAAALSATAGAAILAAGVLLVGDRDRPRRIRPWLGPDMLGVTYSTDL